MGNGPQIAVLVERSAPHTYSKKHTHSHTPPFFSTILGRSYPFVSDFPGLYGQELQFFGSQIFGAKFFLEIFHKNAPRGLTRMI
jgi:hypothetical protein